jgi:hypothetical protein
MLFISEENMANILREVLIIEVLGRAHWTNILNFVVFETLRLPI